MRGGFQQGFTWDILLESIGMLLMALLMGLFIFWIYKKTYMGVVYSRAFAVSLAGMSVLTCSIIVTIQSNLVLSLGMVGALSIVRYRTAIKDPMDLLYLFWGCRQRHCYRCRDVLYLTAGIYRDGHPARGHLAPQARAGRDVHPAGALRWRRRGCTDPQGAGHARVSDQVPKRCASPIWKWPLRYACAKHDLSFVDQMRSIKDVSDVTVVQYDGDYID